MMSVFPHKPKYLYKYQPISPTWSLENLEKRQIWFQRPTDLNDPFDCKNNLEFTLEHGQIEDALEIVRRENTQPDAFDAKLQTVDLHAYRNAVLIAASKYADTLAQELAKGKGIACFSARKDDLLMWSHYAEGHQGYCLEFDTSFDPFNKAFPVNYMINKPRVNILRVLQNRQHFLIPLIFSKAKCWQYEKEWRIFHNAGPGPFRFAHGCLTAIYFGAKMTDKNKCGIKRALNVPSYYATGLDTAKFGLKFIKLPPAN